MTQRLSEPVITAVQSKRSAILAIDFFPNLVESQRIYLFFCILQNGAFNGGHGKIVAVYDSVIVNCIAADKCVVSMYGAEKAAGLIADYGTCGASYDSAADVGVEKVCQVLPGLHGICINLCCAPDRQAAC